MKDINQTEELFDGLFKESLENASAQVPPGVWEGISSSVASASAAGVATQAAIWMKAAIAAVAVAGASYFAYTLYNGQQENPAQSTVTTQTTVNESAPSPEAPVDNTAPATAILDKDAKNTPSHPAKSPVKPSLPAKDKPVQEDVQPNPIYSLDANLEYKPGPQTKTQANEQKETPKTSGNENPNPNMPEPTLEKNTTPYTFVKDSSYIFVPNAVTPDGDGINDAYQIKLVGEESFEIIIYSIDNQILYRSKNKYQSWNCKLPNGEDAPAGSYVVKVIYKFKGQEEKTDIQKLTLIK